MNRDNGKEVKRKKQEGVRGKGKCNERVLKYTKAWEEEEVRVGVGHTIMTFLHASFVLNIYHMFFFIHRKNTYYMLHLLINSRIEREDGDDGNVMIHILVYR